MMQNLQISRIPEIHREVLALMRGSVSLDAPHCCLRRFEHTYDDLDRHADRQHIKRNFGDRGVDSRAAQWQQLGGRWRHGGGAR